MMNRSVRKKLPCWPEVCAAPIIQFSFQEVSIGKVWTAGGPDFGGVSESVGPLPKRVSWPRADSSPQESKPTTKQAGTRMALKEDIVLGMKLSFLSKWR
jgi:hypothetical protein